MAQNIQMFVAIKSPWAALHGHACGSPSVHKPSNQVTVVYAFSLSSSIISLPLNSFSEDKGFYSDRLFFLRTSIKYCLRIICEGFDLAKAKALEVLEQMKIQLTEPERMEILTAVARYTS